jgi:hypothetical protein
MQQITSHKIHFMRSNFLYVSTFHENGDPRPKHVGFWNLLWIVLHDLYLIGFYWMHFFVDIVHIRICTGWVIKMIFNCSYPGHLLCYLPTLSQLHTCIITEEWLCFMYDYYLLVSLESDANLLHALSQIQSVKTPWVAAIYFNHLESRILKSFGVWACCCYKWQPAGWSSPWNITVTHYVKDTIFPWHQKQNVGRMSLVRSRMALLTDQQNCGDHNNKTVK